MNFFKYILIGLLFASVGEGLIWFFVGDVRGYVFATFMYACILVVAFFFGKLIDKLIKKKAVTDIVYFLLFGFIGLMTEWAIGNSPWSNPNAGQFSMFVFHATTYFMPRLFLDKRKWVGKIKKWILRYFVIYFILVFLGLFFFVRSLPPDQIVGWLAFLSFIVGYNVLVIFYLWYFIKNFRAKR
ncbi:MAG: hypothetical protein ABIG28_00500 [archaeon]